MSAGLVVTRITPYTKEEKEEQFQQDVANGVIEAEWLDCDDGIVIDKKCIRVKKQRALDLMTYIILGAIVTIAPLNSLLQKCCKKQLTEKEKHQNMLDQLFTSDSDANEANKQNRRETKES